MILESSIPFIDLKLNTTEVLFGEKLVNNITQNNKKTISLFTHATGDKCYSKDWWAYLYALLLEKFSEYNFIEILPIENISNLSRQAPVFYSKDIRELASFMANTSLVIAADSGIMHLASSSLTPTIGLFSVTDTKTYAPYNDFSVAINTNLTAVESIPEIVSKILNQIN
jgi:ADP-heptose:LPS heptosyltransferase